MRPGRLLLPLTTCVLALAAWVSRGALAVTDAAAWPHRIGILPSRWAPVVLAVVLGAALWRRNRAAWLVLLIPGILLLPWLPIPLPPVALLWTGHVVHWCWAVTALALVGVVCLRRPEGDILRRLGELRSGSVAAFALAFVLYCLAACVVSAVVSPRAWPPLQVPGGDEPHYLVITQSLLADGDVKIENNHEQGDYRRYFSTDLKPDFLRRGKDGEIYSIHSPGLPALVLPAFAVGGYAGVIVFLSLLSALATSLLWRAARRLTGSGGAAWFGWACGALAVPFFVHAFMVYPDAIGGGVVVAAAYALICCESDDKGTAAPGSAEWGRGAWLLLGAALAVLPWLHTRYAVLEVLLVGCLALRLLQRGALAKLAALLAVPAVGAVAWFGYFYAVYGEFSPAAPYGHYTQAAVGNILRGLPALFFDQQFGALPNAPAYALGLLGLFALFRTHRRLAIELTLVVVTYALMVSSYYMWWGGLSAPARFLVPVLLVLGIPAASFWSRQRTVGKAIALGALAVTVLITASLVLVDRGTMLFNDRDGFALWLEWLTPVVDLPHAFPSFIRESTGTALLRVGVWLAVIALAALVAKGIGRRVAGDVDAAARTGLRTAVVFALAAMAAVAANWSLEGTNGATPTSSALSLLRAYDPGRRPLAMRLTPPARMALDEMLRSASLSACTRRPPQKDGPFLKLRDVPPGVYRLSAANLKDARGEVTVRIGDSPVPLVRWPMSDAPRAAHEFTLPVGVTQVAVSGDDEARRTMAHVALEPVAVSPESWRFVAPSAAFAGAYEGAAAFASDPGVYLEGPGMWVTAGQPYLVAFTGAPGAPSIRLLVRNAPVENTVTLRSQARMDVLQMKPGELRVIELPADPRNRGAFLEVTAERGFRPAEVDSNTQDRRYLGLWIQGVPK